MCSDLKSFLLVVGEEHLQKKANIRNRMNYINMLFFENGTVSHLFVDT